MIEILQVSSPTSICDWNAAPLCQLLNQFLVNPFLESFVVGSMDQEL
jgi:hypothetical protein